MKRLLYSAVAAVLFFASCAENEEVVQSNILPSGDFVAMFDEATRTELDGSSVVWHENDQLTIFTNTSHNRQYEIKTLTEDGRTATFGYVGYTGSDNTKIETNYAVYPYNADATLSNGVVTTVLEASQSYNTTNGGLCYALMSAASEDNNFTFVNSGALMRFKVSNILPDEFTLNSIHLTSANHKLAGEVTINFNGDKMAVVTENGVNSITLADINCKVTSEVQEFYVALPATTFDENDLVVVFEFAEGNKEFTLPAFELKQGKIKTISYSIADAEDFIGSTTLYKPANNEIWYAATEKVEPYWDDVFGATIVSNTFDSTTGKGVITFDNDVTNIVANAFWYNTRLTSITIPDSVTTIENCAFIGCSNLTSITIPDNVTEIGNNPFLSCSNLMEFSGRYAEDGGRILVIDGVLKAFAPAGLNQYTIPDSVTTIGYAAFRDCDSLTSLTIPDSVIEIEANSFNGCSNLMEFRGNYAEDGGRILVVDGTLVAFAPAGITEYTIPDSVTTIGERAFYNCDSLTSITISDNVTTIGIYAFDGCNNLASITMGNGVKTIGGCAFWTCTSLTSVIIPDSVKEVDINAFLDCTNLISVTIGKGVETIRDTAFYNCKNLTDVYSEAIIPPVLGDRVFSCYDYDEKNYKPINGNIYVPAESVDAYKAADGWSEYADAIVAYDFEKGEVVE